ncbi:uncharacterized protein LOC141535804 [Cotesia typhae]|uniref:uncharacterized protein LOC141535804 n=1 Tax=Cotesia typhae TaxID=2053667 RepID=UPI003D686D9E
MEQKKGIDQEKSRSLEEKNENSCSVIDLGMVLDRGEEDGVEKFKVIKRIESDHLPIEIELKRQENKIERKEEETRENEDLKKITEERLRWKKEKTEEYMEGTNEKWREKKESTEEIEWNAIKEIIKEVAKMTKMNKKVRNGKRGGTQKKEWFSDRCKELREDVWKKLKELTKYGNNNEEKKKYSMAKKKIQGRNKESERRMVGREKKGDR